MSRRSEKSALRRAALVALATAPLAIGAGGCDEYLDRRETITLGVGDSVQTNKATQEIRRWPAAAREAYWDWDGERARQAMQRYRSRAARDSNLPSATDKDAKAAPANGQ